MELESISPDSKSRILPIPLHDGTERYILSNTDLYKLTFKKSEVHQFGFFCFCCLSHPILTTLASINPLTIELGYYLLFIISPKVGDTK